MPRKALTRDELAALMARVEADVADARELGKPVSVNISGGNGSAACLFRCQVWFADVSAVFADTLSEHSDLYRFLDDVEKSAGIEIERLSQSMDKWDVWNREGAFVMRQQNLCLASKVLKREPLARHLESLPESTVVAIGMDRTEPERMARLLARSDRFIFPLACKPSLSECDFRAELKRRGIALSTLYGEKFEHNNCGGGCALAGSSDWARHYRLHPEEFAKEEASEIAFNERRLAKGKKPFTILRDQRNGKTVPYTLTELRRDVDAGRKFRPAKVPNCSCLFDV